ncbi:transcription factor IIIC subunit delta N-term-domain-containing protein [Melanogaster broomeanus]|nr:transcription factor IIIC subunit delta N-term-domain-containing protein [Melanogaster broomeanus]
MSQLPIYTALSVPTILTHPSIRCLQWSEDGQLCLVTKYAVHIMTPDPGVNFSTRADIKTPISDEQSDRPLGWYRTMIECTRGQTHSWPAISQGWGALSLGSLDVSVRAVACSPSGLTSRGRCVLAVLNSNMEVSLWVASKNHLKGEWSTIQDVTGYMLDLPGLDRDIDEASRTLGSQVMSIAWSGQPHFGIYPAPLVDASVLAVGTRAGSVKLLRFKGNVDSEGMVYLIREAKFSEKWITHLSWSPWFVTSDRKCQSVLAYATDDGAVGLITISQILQTTLDPGFVPTYALELVSEQQTEAVCAPNKCAVPTLDWIAVPGRNPILVFSKPGVIHLWSWPSSLTQWHGGRVLFIQAQRLSIGSSEFSPVSGLSYVKQRDVLLVSLFDGSLHVVHNFSVEPSWTPTSSEDQLTSEALSQASRAFFAQATPAGIGYMDVNRISGLVSYDLHSTLTWIYESLRPSDFSYKHEARHESMFLTAPFWLLDEDTILRATHETLILMEYTATRSVPLYRLRPLLLHLCNTGRFAELCPSLLEVLNQIPPDDSPTVVVPPWSQGLGDDLQLQLRRSFATHLFGWDGLLSLRMRLSVADMCWRLCNDPQLRVGCGQVAQNQLVEISYRILRILVRHLTAIVTALTPSDVPFVLRVVVQSRLAGSPLDLSSEAEALSNKVNETIAIDPKIAGLHELCPACHIEVPLEDVTRATCPNGHSWARCSVTSFILSTSMVRTCIGCSRKALLPVSQSSATDESWLPIAARSWVVKELLEAVQRCLFCGNSFRGHCVSRIRWSSSLGSKGAIRVFSVKY